MACRAQGRKFPALSQLPDQLPDSLAGSAQVDARDFVQGWVTL